MRDEKGIIHRLVRCGVVKATLGPRMNEFLHHGVLFSDKLRAGQKKSRNKI